MLMAAQDLLKQSSLPGREEIREHLSGNYCRCTGYQAIVDAVEAVARARAGTKELTGPE
jgi:carbon-monoxide dehydrogenase small subunit